MPGVIGEIHYENTTRGVRYFVKVDHEELGKSCVIKDQNRSTLQLKAQAKIDQWDSMWQRKRETERKREEKRREIERRKAAKKAAQREKEEKTEKADELTLMAQTALQEVSETLISGLDIDPESYWKSIMVLEEFSESEPERPKIPKRPSPIDKPDMPVRGDYEPQLNILDKLFKSRQEKKLEYAKSQYENALDVWKRECSRIDNENQRRKEKYEDMKQRRKDDYKKALHEWNERKSEFEEERAKKNEEVRRIRAEYESGDREAVEYFCRLVLEQSDYPDWMPKKYEIAYNPVNAVIVMDVELPEQSNIPALESVRYIKSRDEFREKELAKSKHTKMYDNLLYQIALRSIHEVFSADHADQIKSVVFNGYVDSIDPSTGKRIHPCVLSIQANEDEFEGLDLSAVYPKACFKSLKGIGSSKLHTLTPVAPVLQLSKEDGRFVEGRSVVGGIDESENLAAMDWEDFEHLIRELFESEFAKEGEEVRVTQASRDGGVDAIAYDPDPIRGGKIVIQAKRYTNTVGVAAVRDLYGTIVNEGATKGILVCTSDYGPDAYKFAKDKPIVLLNGGQLLHMLEKHGHKAKIDLKEAKAILKEREEGN